MQVPLDAQFVAEFRLTDNQGSEDLRLFSAISAQVNALQAVYHYLREEQRELLF